LADPKELIKRVKALFLKKSRRMTRELKKALIGKTIKNVEVLWNGGDIYIKLATDKGPIVIGANDLGVWIDKLKIYLLQQKERGFKLNEE
jgi:ribosomal protein S3